MKNIQVRLLQQDLISIYGITPIMPYDWAMNAIKEGHAEIYSAVKKQQANPNKLPFSLPEEPIVIETSKVVPLSSKKNYEIVWIQDNNMMGGAELSNQTVIEVGNKLGFNIHTLTPQNFDIIPLRKAKLLIINNLFTFTPSQMIEIKRAIFEFEVPYVKYEHDMRELKQERLELSRRLYKHSKANVFISPMQLEEYKKLIYNTSENFIFPLAIDTDLFKPNPKIKRNIKKVVHTSGNLHNKGLQTVFSMVRQYPDRIFELYIGDHNLVAQMFANSKNVILKTRIENDKMPDVYSSAGHLVHVPTGKWAGERVVFEAALCGCKLITNDNIGHLSWGFNLEDIEGLRVKLEKAPYDFWKVMEKVL